MRENLGHEDQEQKQTSARNGHIGADFSPILSALQDMHAKYQPDYQGKVATYIPELAKADPHLFGIALVTADVTADEPAICYVLSIAKLDELAILHPEIRAKLVFNIARELSARLRRADAEIRSLEE